MWYLLDKGKHNEYSADTSETFRPSQNTRDKGFHRLNKTSCLIESLYGITPPTPVIVTTYINNSSD